MSFNAKSKKKQQLFRFQFQFQFEENWIVIHFLEDLLFFKQIIKSKKIKKKTLNKRG